MTLGSGKGSHGVTMFNVTPDDYELRVGCGGPECERLREWIVFLNPNQPVAAHPSWREYVKKQLLSYIRRLEKKLNETVNFVRDLETKVSNSEDSSGEYGDSIT